MLYASPACWGFTSRSERGQFEDVVRRLNRYHYLPDETPTFGQLYISEQTLPSSQQSWRFMGIDYALRQQSDTEGP